jgi:hypothetical protein
MCVAHTVFCHVPQKDACVSDARCLELLVEHMRRRVFACERRGGSDSGSERRPFLSIPQYAWLFIDLAGLVRGALARAHSLGRFAFREILIFSCLHGPKCALRQQESRHNLAHMLATLFAPF